MTKSKLVSIIIPVFNNEKDIRETLSSLQKQTYEDWEAICVDDGSTDTTCNIIRQVLAEDGRIKLFVRERQPKGGSTCRNIGLEASKGDYVIFLDGDDLLSANSLKNRIKIIDDTDYDFAIFPMATFRKDVTEKRILTRFDVRDADYYYMTGSSIWQVTSPIYRASFIKKLKGFDERFSRMQDIELGLRSIVVSQGNYIQMNEDNLDCYYRMPIGKTAVATVKFIKTLESYGYMLDTINKLHHQGYLNDRYKYSMGLLATYCRILQVIDIVKGRNESVKGFNDYNTVDLQSEMCWYHGLILRIMKTRWLPLKYHMKLVHLCDQYCRWHFLK